MDARLSLGPDTLRLHDHHSVGDGPACMFCAARLDGWDGIEDPTAFSLHLSQSESCRTEYQLYNQAIRDEWPSD